jgi:hypothetical protein
MMMDKGSFGRRAGANPSAIAFELPRPSRRQIVRLAAMLALLAAAFTVQTWFNILHVPLARPIAPLFSSGPASNQGWAAWYIPPLVAGVLAFPLAYWLLIRRKQLTIVAMAVAGIGMLLLGAVVAYWVKNIGYTWYFVPGASVSKIVPALFPMLQFALGNAVAGVMIHQPWLLIAASAAGAVLGWLAALPIKRQTLSSY